jgi:hypothetical protein
MLIKMLSNLLLFCAIAAGRPVPYVNAENITFIGSIKKNLIGAVKSNLEVALSKKDRANGKFVKISQLKMNPGDLKEVYIRSVSEPVLICKGVFTNEDNSEGELFLLCTDLTKSYRTGDPAICHLNLSKTMGN